MIPLEEAYDLDFKLMLPDHLLVLGEFVSLWLDDFPLIKLLQDEVKARDHLDGEVDELVVESLREFEKVPGVY